MSFQRRILHHNADLSGSPQLISLSAVKSCWFELHRQGGCGSGQLILSDSFQQRDSIQIGDWISLEATSGDRWYLGRVEERQAEIPAGVRLRLEGMSVELNQIFPGGFGEEADGQKPQLYAATDLFHLDPDEFLHTYNWVESAEQLVRILIEQSLPDSSHIQYDPTLIETPRLPAPITSIKVRGEESIRALLKDLALRAQSASWGVNEQGQFFFLRRRDETIATFQEQSNLTTLSESRDLEFVLNRILLTGDYVYDNQDHSDDQARRSYRWRANFIEPASRAQFGDRRIRVWLPWIRTQGDGLAFAREFFRTYSQSQSQYFLETTETTSLPRPWLGQVEVLSKSGERLVKAHAETIRVFFDHVPRFRMILGPIDPRLLWPEPPHDERWELPNQHAAGIGGHVSMSDHLGGGGDGGGGGGGGSGSNGAGWSEGDSLDGSNGEESLNSENDSSVDSLESDSGSWASSLPPSSGGGIPPTYWPPISSYLSGPTSFSGSIDSEFDSELDSDDQDDSDLGSETTAASDHDNSTNTLPSWHSSGSSHMHFPTSFPTTYPQTSFTLTSFSVSNFFD
ncbi:hypothetical protein [Planctomicrobium sp. SH527]|uniref:hypothetical protein n=1 Tax=Planctomicrobium sp. SH527 TaxID=3448123 RepID=UPI003F5C2A2E